VAERREVPPEKEDHGNRDGIPTLGDVKALVEAAHADNHGSTTAIPRL
jgi:hypothetical protein